MKYVEDVLVAARGCLFHHDYKPVLGSDWFVDFVENVYQWTQSGKSLTTEQSKIVMRVLEKSRKYFVKHGIAVESDVAALIANPLYRRPLVPSANIVREVRWLGSNLLGFRFKRDDTLSEKFRNLRAGVFDEEVQYDFLKRIWIVPVHARNVDAIEAIISDRKFHFDDEVVDLLVGVHNQEPTTITVDPDTGEIVITTHDPLLSKWATVCLGGIEE